MRRALLPLSWLYGLGVTCRNAAFEAGILRVEKVGVPVISVGNMTAGGTGKTPLVEFLAEYLIGKGRHPGVISRGYGRESHGVVIVSDGRTLLADVRRAGDEPRQIAEKLRGAIVVVGERRVGAARMALALGADVIIMDDGFQHRYLARDLNILVLDARRPIAEEPLLPAGLRREPLGGLRRADIIALSRAEKKPAAAWKYAGIPDIPLAAYRYSVACLKNAADGTILPRENVAGVPVVAFSGIGDHAAFLDTVKSLGAQPVTERRFRDHYRYTDEDIEGLLTLMRQHGARLFVTTEKDAVRLKALPRARALEEGGRLTFPLITVDFVEGKDQLLGMVDRTTRKEGTL